MSKRVKRGDPLVIAADDWNAMLDAVDAVKRMARPRPVRGASATDRDIVVVANASGSTVARGEVLGLDDVLVTPAADEDGFVRNPMFSGVTPAAGAHEGRFAVMVGPAGDGLLGRGVVAGTVVAKVNVSNANHALAEIANGSTVLASAEHGSARILWKPSGTGEKWAVVRLGDVHGANGGGTAVVTGTVHLKLEATEEGIPWQVPLIYRVDRYEREQYPHGWICPYEGRLTAMSWWCSHADYGANIRAYNMTTASSTNAPESAAYFVAESTGYAKDSEGLVVNEGDEIGLMVKPEIEPSWPDHAHLEVHFYVEV